MVARSSRFRLGLGIFLLIATVRLTLVLVSATEIPFYDAWQTTIDQMALPILAHNFDVATLFITHNEHVFVPTRLVDLFALAAADVQYDAMLVCTINQLLYAAIAAALIVAALPSFETRARLFVLTAVLYACIPFDFENIAQPLTSMYGFLIAFSCALLAVCAFACSVGGGVGILVSGAMASLSVGTGFVASIVGLGVIAVRWRRRRLNPIPALVFAITLLFCIGLGVVFATRALPAAHAIGAVQFAQIVLLGLVWLPTLFLAVRVVSARAPAVRDIATVAISIWGAIEILAMIVARPEFRIWLPISRYMEILGVAAFADIACLMRLRESRGAVALAKRCALPVLLCAIVCLAPYAWSWFAVRADQLSAQSQRVERYVREHDSRAFDDAPIDELAYPSLEFLRSRLDQPDVQYILGDAYGTRPHPAALIRGFRAATHFVAATAWLWWIAAAGAFVGLSRRFFRSAGYRAPAENELA